MFAWLTTSTPARASVDAFAGGAWNAKQFDDPPPHFDAPPEPNVPSRLSAAKSARRRTEATGASCGQPRSGGRPYDEPSVVSPPQTIVGPGSCAAAGAASAAPISAAPASARVKVPVRIDRDLRTIARRPP